MTKGGQAQESTDKGFKHMTETVRHRLIQLLLARFLLLRLLVEEARNLQGGLQQEHRRLWVLLQVQPNLFRMDLEGSVFEVLAQLLRPTSITYMLDSLRHCRLTLSVWLQPNDTRTHTFFCVLDEAQITVSQGPGRMGEFISCNGQNLRPILRAIWLSWSEILEHHMRLVLSGTGIDFETLDATLSSSVFKLPKYGILHNTGAFDDPEVQTAYIKRYLPLDDKCWKEFSTRACAWLRGR
jgi:hypothetical protein